MRETRLADIAREPAPLQNPAVEVVNFPLFVAAAVVFASVPAGLYSALIGLSWRLGGAVFVVRRHDDGTISNVGLSLES